MWISTSCNFICWSQMRKFINPYLNVMVKLFWLWWDNIKNVSFLSLWYWTIHTNTKGWNSKLIDWLGYQLLFDIVLDLLYVWGNIYKELIYIEKYLWKINALFILFLFFLPPSPFFTNLLINTLFLSFYFQSILLSMRFLKIELLWGNC